MTQPTSTGPTRTTITELRPALAGQKVLDAMRRVIDPELGLDVVSLGLVYAVTVVDAAVAIEMTLTTPGCPLHGSIEADVRRRLQDLPEIGSVDVALVWDPPWTPDAMTDQARRALGFP